MVGRELAKLRKKYPGLEVQEIDVIAHPVQAIRNKIKMIPALKIGDHAKIIGFDPDSVKKFVEANIGLASS
ncbi:MAG: hypothetical protein OEM02_12615 [Desulfobulbaceae bacterium]|nr:hypothetical protein [Desulfobulbaceae bacterium]